MRIVDIVTWRDGGTITFTIEASDLAGRYRLQTPFAGEPRPLFQNDSRLVFGGPEETALVMALGQWLSMTMTPESQRALPMLDCRAEWRNLPDDLRRAVPLHRIRTVIRCLQAR